MCYYWNCWCHMNYLFHVIYNFLCYHRHFTWCHPWRSSRFTFSLCSIGTSLRITPGGLPGFLRSGVSIGTSIGTTLGGLPGFLVYVCTFGVVACSCCCLVGYLCVTCACPCSVSFSTSHRRPVFLLVNCCSAPLGMMLNNSARFLSAV